MVGYKHAILYYLHLSTPVINGKPKDFFRGWRCIHHGDPLSHCLFVLVMEVLSKILDGKVGKYQIPHPKCMEPLINHLCYTADLMIFTKGDINLAMAIRSALMEFKVITWFSTNNLKITVIYGHEAWEQYLQVVLVFILNKMINDFRRTMMNFYPLGSQKTKEDIN